MKVLLDSWDDLLINVMIIHRRMWDLLPHRVAREDRSRPGSRPLALGKDLNYANAAGVLSFKSLVSQQDTRVRSCPCMRGKGFEPLDPYGSGS